MILKWHVRHSHHKFFGEMSPHTQLRAKLQTPYGAAELRLRVVWDIPLSRFSERFPELVNDSRRRNYCRGFTVVMPGKPPELLVRRTLDYFDGPGSMFMPTPQATVFCDRKWIASARDVINRYGDNRERNLIALSDFMLRRMRNAYSPLFR